MADGKPIEVKLLEVLSASATLQGLLATDANADLAIYVALASPTGVRYPSLHFEWVEGASQEKLPAGNGTLHFTITQSPDSTEKYKVFTQIRDEIATLLNRNASEPLTEINFPGNTGLRVVKILRSTSDFGFREKVDKHISIAVFEVVKSEGEDFSKDYGSWPC